MSASAQQGGDSLWAAAAAGDVAAVSALLSSPGVGASPDARGGPTQCTALHAAVEGGFEIVVQILLAHGADPRAGDSVRPHLCR